MDQHPISGQLQEQKTPIILEGTFRGKYRAFAIFLIACALLVAAFAISAVWLQKGGTTWLEGAEKNEGENGGEPLNTGGAGEINTNPESEEENESNTEAIEPIPDGAIPIVDMDLSAPTLGDTYIHNETPYTPDVSALLRRPISQEEPVGDKPLVLILHTHTSEAYLPQGTRYVEGVLGDVTYSREEAQNVLSVGKVLCDTLNEKGITAIHCTVMHDDPTLSGSYSRSAETVKKYLETYPSIAYVIDLHRDAVTDGNGAFVRSVASYKGEEIAQVLTVIGTDCNGTSHDRWSGNLALALQLREALNQMGEGICRPASLRNSSYNQELAKYSLILEIGTAANSMEESQRTARLVGEALAELIQKR